MRIITTILFCRLDYKPFFFQSICSWIFYAYIWMGRAIDLFWGVKRKNGENQELNFIAVLNDKTLSLKKSKSFATTHSNMMSFNMKKDTNSNLKWYECSASIFIHGVAKIDNLFDFNFVCLENNKAFRRILKRNCQQKCRAALSTHDQTTINIHMYMSIA